MTNGTRSRYIPSPRAPGRPDWLERLDIEAAIVRAVRMGLTDPKAGVYAGVTAQTVLRYRKKHHIPPNSKRGTRRDNERSTR